MSQFLEQLLLDLHDLIQSLDHMYGNADGARLVCNRASNGLANPPCCIGRKLVASTILEFLDRLHQSHVSFLNQVEEGQSSIGVFLGNGND